MSLLRDRNHWMDRRERDIEEEGPNPNFRQDAPLIWAMPKATRWRLIGDIFQMVPGGGSPSIWSKYEYGGMGEYVQIWVLP